MVIFLVRVFDLFLYYDSFPQTTAYQGQIDGAKILYLGRFLSFRKIRHQKKSVRVLYSFFLNFSRKSFIITKKSKGFFQKNLRKRNLSKKPEGFFGKVSSFPKTEKFPKNLKTVYTNHENSTRRQLSHHCKNLKFETQHSHKLKLVQLT